MQEFHRRIDAFRVQNIDGAPTRIYGIANAGQFILTRRSQHVTGYLIPVTGVSDTDPQPQKFSSTVSNDIAQTVVSAVPATHLEAGRTGRQIQFVVNDEYAFRRQLEVVDRLTH